MSGRTIIFLAASLIFGTASIATISTEALAHRKIHSKRAATVLVGVIVTDTGPAADRVPKCFDSVIRYPYPPCY